MKKLLFLLLALFTLAACGGRDEDPTPTAAPQISSEFHGTWKVMQKMNVGGGYIDNTDTSLYITVSAYNIKYKLQNGGVFDGTGVIEKASNADQITLTNGTKAILFKTIKADGTQNFLFQHASGLKDDILVKKN